MRSAKEFRDMSDDELLAELATIRKDLFGLRFQHATGELENTAGLGSTKRALARALTIARERGVEAGAARTEN